MAPPWGSAFRAFAWLPFLRLLVYKRKVNANMGKQTAKAESCFPAIPGTVTPFEDNAPSKSLEWVTYK